MWTGIGGGDEARLEGGLDSDDMPTGCQECWDDTKLINNSRALIVFP